MLIRVYGVGDVVNRLEEIKERVREFISREIQEVGDYCVKRARELAPVRTGRLRSSINMRIVAGGVVVEATAPYAGYVEYGTRFMRPRPYIRPAVREALERLMQRADKLMTR